MYSKDNNKKFSKYVAVVIAALLLAILYYIGILAQALVLSGLLIALLYLVYPEKFQQAKEYLVNFFSKETEV